MPAHETGAIDKCIDVYAQFMQLAHSTVANGEYTSNLVTRALSQVDALINEVTLGREQIRHLTAEYRNTIERLQTQASTIERLQTQANQANQASSRPSRAWRRTRWSRRAGSVTSTANWFQGTTSPVARCR